MSIKVFMLLLNLYSVCCQNFYAEFLGWQLISRRNTDFEYCFSLNFGFGSSLEMPTFSMHVNLNETKRMLFNREMLSSASEDCLLIFVGDKYVEKIEDINKMVKQLSREVGTRPTALFVNTKHKYKVISSDILYYPLVSHKNQ